MTQRTKFGVFGYPIQHSLSPVMQNAAFQEKGMTAFEYQAYEVNPKDLKNAILKAQKDGFLGINLTIPHKEKALDFDFIQPDSFAEKVGAANTLLISHEKIEAFNTDAYGALSALEYEGIDTKNKKILIIGAGGASRSISFLFGEQGNFLKIINRTAEKAESLAAEITKKTGNKKVFGSGFQTAWNDVKEADIIIQTTEIGMGKYENVSVFDLWDVPKNAAENAKKTKNECLQNYLRKETVVFDIVYRPMETKFLREARLNGCHTINGVMMLVFQGAFAFEIWTKEKPNIDMMKETVLFHLKKE
ncbi:MAG: shikimate dehydrogenase [Methanimicrococcus sp.]|nr:shikimate dehydrogenase [Methanimicrococcus sp.]